MSIGVQVARLSLDGNYGHGRSTGKSNRFNASNNKTEFLRLSGEKTVKCGRALPGAMSSPPQTNSWSW